MSNPITQQRTMDSINPATGELMEQFPIATPEQTDRALEKGNRAFRAWRQVPFEERAQLMKRAASYLRANKARLAALITTEMGKIIGESESEIEKCAWNCDYYADNAPRFLADEPHPSAARESYVSFQPLGMVLAMMPWNFPFWQLFRFAAPALMAGNTAVLKHASNVPRCALAIEEVFTSSGFPEGVFQTLLISGSKADELIADPRVAAVTLTGSTEAGSKVAAAAGKAIKKSVLELGGSDPFIVLEDADLEQAATIAARARMQNTGQSCIAAKRFIVVEEVADAFLARFTTAVASMKMGNPMDRETEVGPLAREDLLDALDRQVRSSVEGGAQLVFGGHRDQRPGFFYSPTVLTRVVPWMNAFRQETFGPVAAVIRVHDSEEALELANDSIYGLGASLWTQDLDRAKGLARRIEAGSVFINGMVSSDPHLPFGGVKQSGFGRELSEFGIREFTNIQTIWVGPPISPQPPQVATE